MSEVRKAVITAAGRGTRQYPASTTVHKEMFPLVDRDGLTKPTIQIIAEEALDSGIDQIAIVVSPGDESSYQNHFSAISEELLPAFRGKEWALQQSQRVAYLQDIITYIPQPSPEGYGHAVWCARDWVGHEPFLLLLGDHVYISHTDKRCARQLIDVYEQFHRTTIALRETPENRLHLFGTVAGQPIEPRHAVYRITHIKEKPDIRYAREHLRVPGLAEGMYLCFFGMYILTPRVFDCIEYHIKNDIRERGEIQLTNALEMLRQQEGTYGTETLGERYDMGIPFGYVETQVALALYGINRTEILQSLRRIIKQSSGEDVIGLIDTALASRASTGEE
ncbi:MAG: UTP--glucose-1-phosphate uridylyltransferase [Anaerolineae bacterium]